MGSEEAPNKIILATGGYDHTIHFWQPHSGVRLHSVQHPSSQVNDMEITPNRQLLAAAGFQHIRMYDIFSTNPNPVVNYEGVAKNFTAVGFQEDGRWMYTGSEDNAARIWDLRSRTLQCQRLFPTNFPVNCVCLHPNQSELFIGDQGGMIYLWDLRLEHPELQAKKTFFKVSESDVSIQHIHIDAEGRVMAAVDNKGNCYLFTLHYEDSEHPHTHPIKRLKFEAHKTYALKCKFSPDSTLLATASADSTAKIWRTSDLHLLLDEPQSPSSSMLKKVDDIEVKKPPSEPLTELKAKDQRWVWDIVFSSDSQYIFTASSDNLARLYSVATGEVKREFNGHSKALTALAFKDRTC